jgi:hypothetical protein
MKIPSPLIYTVADVLGSYYFSHTKLDTLFGENGFPGEPPAGNCVNKCQSWMKRANDECEDEALGMLSSVMEEFMNLEHSDGSPSKVGYDRIKQALAKVCMEYDFDGIVPISKPATEIAPIAATVPVVSNGPALSHAHSTRRFRVALSFPGERRLFIAQIAATLATEHGKARILYDQFYEAEFARPDLDVYLPNLYRTNSDLICIFLCADYAQKRFCNLEWRFIRQLIATEDHGRIMFLSFDPIAAIPEIGILSGDGYVSIGSRTPEQIAALINERLAL